MPVVADVLNREMRDNVVLISGHGCYVPGKLSGYKIKIPGNITVTLWCDLGAGVEDGSVGRYLDRGCLESAFNHLQKEGHGTRTIPKRYLENDEIENLILTPPDGLTAVGRTAGMYNPNDDMYAFAPTNPIKDPTGTRPLQMVGAGSQIPQEGRFAKDISVKATSLWHIMQHVLDTKPGVQVNLHWAACLVKVTHAPTKDALTATAKPFASGLLIESGFLRGISFQLVIAV